MKSQDKLIALTFDDGVNFETTVPTLDVLERHGVVGTFFVCGKYLTDDTEPILLRAYRMGCELCNHSYSHANMAELSPQEITQEVESTSKLVLDSVGVSPKFFRPPYIALNQTMFDTINLPFIEGFGCNDWDEKVSVESRVSGILDHAQDGNIILLHDLQGNAKTVSAIDIAIPRLKGLGFKLVTVSQLFALNGITPEVHKNLIYSNVESPKVCSWSS